MPKSKFYVKDDDGTNYMVEEMDEDPTLDEDPALKENTSTCDDEPLLPEEISALKRLAAVADQLIALTTTTDSVGEEGVDEEMLDEDPTLNEDVVDTDAVNEEDPKAKGHDSRRSVKSFGSIEKKKTTKDSINVQENISDAWAKRYNGGK